MELNFAETTAAIRAVASVLKTKHPNLTVDETLDLAYQIIVALMNAVNE